MEVERALFILWFSLLIIALFLVRYIALKALIDALLRNIERANRILQQIAERLDNR